MKVQITIKINRVHWDTDGFSYKECGLPATLRGSLIKWNVEAENEEDCDTIAIDCTSDWLSDTFGYCHNGWDGGVIDRTVLPDDTDTEESDGVFVDFEDKIEKH